MRNDKIFDAIIVGGSYAGLSAAMGLGRALRDVLVIDGGQACNRMTPHSHNFLTQDGRTPAEIQKLARRDLEAYGTVSFIDGLATEGVQVGKGFEITVSSGETLRAKKLVFASGVKDIMPEVDGFAQCWGRSIIHCPYCHGYEVRNEKTGIFGNAEYGFEFSKLISNWTDDLTLYTDGPSELLPEQTARLEKRNIEVVDKKIDRFEHVDGQIERLIFVDGSAARLKALYAKVPFVQHCNIPEKLGCIVNEMGYLSTDMFHETKVEGVYACGDNTTFLRSVSNAVATGTTTAAMLNKELIYEEF